MIKKYLLSVLGISLSLGLFAQKYSKEYTQYSEEYPDANGVFIQNNEDAFIEINEAGELEISSDHYEERIFLNDNFKYYMYSAIHFSAFNSIDKVKPSVEIFDGDKYKTSKIKNIYEEDSYTNWIFHDDSRNKNFFYKGLDVGGKTKLSYSKTYFEPHLFGAFYFSSYLPVKEATYTLTTPASMEITSKIFGDEKEKISYSVETKGNKKIHTWTGVNLKQIEQEEGAVSTSYFATHVIVYVNSYEFKNEKKSFIRDVNDLHTYYRTFVKEVNQDTSDVLNTIADSITAGIDNPDEKVKTIFYWVQDNIKYVAFEDGMGGFIPRNASLVCSRRYGDCKDMSSILYQMINHVGVPAYYTWIGSRDIPYTYEQVPTPYSDNHMICAYHNGENYVFLDATGKNLPFGMPTALFKGKRP